MSTSSDQNQIRPEVLPLRAKPPSATIAFNKRTVIGGVIGLASLAGFAILDGFSSNSNNQTKPQADNRPAQVGEAVRNLPSDYSALPKPKQKLGPPLRGELGPTELAFKQQTTLSDEEKFQAELKLQRIKQAIAARNADISFPGMKLDQHPSNMMMGGSRDGLSDTSLAALGNLPAQSSNQRDNDNRQDDKDSFLTQNRDEATLVKGSLRSPLSKYQLMAGALLPGVMLTGINSDLPGQILGQISQGVYDSKTGAYLLLPQGTKVIGEYDSRITYGQDRVLIVWTRLLLPNGKSISLEGMPGVDLSGYAGLHEKVNNHYFRLITGVVLGSILGAGAQVAQGSNHTVDPSFGQLAVEGVAQNINEAGQQITRKNLNIQPTLEISPGQRFNIFVTKDLILEPYKQ